MMVSIISDRRADHPRRAVGVGVVVVGAAVAAALTGAGGARADDTGTISATDALGFLDSATTDLTDAKDLLSTAVVPDLFQSTLIAETRFANELLGFADKFEGAQDPLLTSHDTVVAETANVLFSGSDQQFAQASEAVLSADKAFVADPSLTTEYESLAPADFQMFFAVIDEDLPYRFALIADQLLGLGSSDTASADPASSSVAAGDLLTQASAELTQTAVLDSAPTASLDASELQVLAGAEQTVTAEQSTMPLLEGGQAGLPAADQAVIIDVDSRFLNANTGLLDAAQGFASADQAGDLTNTSIFPLALAALSVIGENFNVDFADLGIDMLGMFDPSLLAAF
jgi:hypothetical protein